MTTYNKITNRQIDDLEVKDLSIGMRIRDIRKKENNSGRISNNAWF